MQEKRRGPWLVSVNPFAAHDPFDFLREYYDRYDPKTLPPPRFRPGELDDKHPSQTAYYKALGFERTTELQRQEMKAAYYATIEHIDAEIGRLLAWLDEAGQRENTPIIFTADHGEMLGDHGIFTKGPFLYDPAVRVPLIFSWPGRVRAGRRYDGLVELVDIVPTIHDLLGLEIPERVQGKSLAPILTGEIPPAVHKEGVYAEYYNSNPAVSLPGRKRVYATMWRDKRYKIIVHHGEEYGELYDLEKDPDEFENRWADPAYRDLRFDLVKRCFDARVFTMDPLPPRVAPF